MSMSSSQLAKNFALMLDGMGIVWIDEIATWIAPNDDGTHRVLSSDEVREMLFDYMDRADSGFTEGKMNGTFKMASLKQKLKRARLNETCIAFTDGKLNTFTFEFEPFPDEWRAGRRYEKGDRARYGRFDYSALADVNGDGDPPSGSPGKWHRLHPHASLALTRLNMTYAEAMAAPEPVEWLRFLSQVFVEEDGRTPSEELLSVVRPMCGYFLMPHLKGNKIFMLAGPLSFNGKSTFMKLIELLLPEGSVTARRFNEFASSRGPNWGKADLIAKRLVLCSEESSRDVDAGQIKQFADGMTPMQAERKFQQPFSFFPTFKILAAFNTPPDFTDVDRGVLRRFFYIPCNAEFDGSTSVDEIVDRVMAEKQLILAWMVREAKKLHEKKWLFPIDGKLLGEAKDTYMADQNSVIAFCREKYRIVNRPEKGTPVTDIYRHYLEWCAENGYRQPFGKRNFGIMASKRSLGDSHVANGTRYRRAVPKDTGKLL
jgi:P4 family phage/plasmid primase-like protien